MVTGTQCIAHLTADRAGHQSYHVTVLQMFVRVDAYVYCAAPSLLTSLLMHLVR
jgi:hypothetical protein